jgi:probable phosphoglycerate mutase
MDLEHKNVKTVYFVRHGQSADNVAPVFQSPDSPLNEKGREQARLIADRASKLSFDALISSPFRRARETAETIAAACGNQVEYSELFVERIKPTSIDGKPYTDEAANAKWRQWEQSLFTPSMRIEDGENFDDLIARADSALDYLLSRPEQSLLVVTHGYFLRTIVSRVLFGDQFTAAATRNFQMSAATQNTGITVLRYHGAFEEDPRWRLWIFNDHAHLG